MKYKANILVVDDDIPVCKSISSALKAEGHIVDMAYSGEEALKKEPEKKYAVMVIDLMMPGLDGIELIEKVKKRNSDITLIMITGYPSIKKAVQSIKLGAFDFLPKPFTPDELLSIVSRALEKRFIYEEIAAEKEIAEIKLVTLHLPPGQYYCIPDNSWVKIEKEGHVTIGIHHIFLRSLIDITSIHLPKLGTIKHQGETCLTIKDSQNKTHRLWSPTSGKVIQINENIKKDPTILMIDPYQEGWIIKMEPTQLEEDLKNLKNLNTG